MLALTIVLVSWMAGVRLPFGLPGGLAAVVLGTVLAWLAKLVHLDELMQPAEVVSALGQFGLRLPYPSTDFARALGDIGPLLVTAVLGSPFPPTVYIGHPGWTAVGEAPR